MITRRDGLRAFAMLNRSVPEAQAHELMRRGLEQDLTLEQLARTARRLGHAPIGWLRSDDEHVSVCGRCGARIYARLGARVVEDGEGLSERCQDERT